MVNFAVRTSWGGDTGCEAGAPCPAASAATDTAAIMNVRMACLEYRFTMVSPLAGRAGYGSAKTNSVLPAAGRNSGVRRLNAPDVSDVPVLAATYCLPSTA